MANTRTNRDQPALPLDSRCSSYFLRRYQLRDSSRSRKRTASKLSVVSHASSVQSSSPIPRPVLVSLHPNLRRLPSRLMALSRERIRATSDATDVPVGSKRKRVASGNENAYFNSHSTRSGMGFKRQRSATDTDDTSEDEDTSGQSTMDMDEQKDFGWVVSHDLDSENPLDHSDEFLINIAAPRRLHRLRKDELIRLHDLAGLNGTTEDLTKNELVDALVSARGEDGELPPSSPPSRTEGNSSDYSSDGGNDGGGEETDAALSSQYLLRRRATVQNFAQDLVRPTAERTFSLTIPESPSLPLYNFGKKVARIAKNVKSPVKQFINATTRRGSKQTSQSSPIAPVPSVLPLSPPAKRLRSRTLSSETSSRASSSCSSGSSATPSRPRSNDSTSHTMSTRRRGKSKQVVHDMPGEFGESDLTDLTESSSSQRSTSSRGTRSRRKVSTTPPTPLTPDQKEQSVHKRITPMRKAKGRIKSMKESSGDDEANGDRSEEEGSNDEEEVDQLEETPPKGLRGQRTPMKKRLRPRTRLSKPPSDGDDEDEDSDADLSSTPGNKTVRMDMDTDEEETAEDVEEDIEESPPVEPKRLRNGKIVGEEEVQDEDEDSETLDGSESASMDEAEEDELSGAEVEEAEEEIASDEEGTDDDVDLSTATQKTLVRQRRDDLVRLCQARELEVDGTKAQLAQALLEWRASQRSPTTTPSSSSTIRPTSNQNGRKGRTSNKRPTPVLLRSERVHIDEPLTPQVAEDKKDHEPELELDLESLGLEEREIPPEKLVKLEKIGSGGFKDVFIGKFRGRKVAIAEFRDQLSTMDIKELKLLAEFAHPNIVRFLGVSIPENTKETPVMIVSELCHNGDLFDYIRNVPAPSLFKVLSMMLDVARGLQYLHEHKPSIIHRDCKSSNILITSKGIAKIADFGLAKVKQSTKSMVRSLVGTVNWQAPELWTAHPKYNHKVDVFSCACVFWEMLQWNHENKKFPWEGMNEHAIYEAVGAKRLRPPLTGSRKQWCGEIVDLIEKMWAQDPQDRPDISEVVDELHEIIRIHR